MRACLKTLLLTGLAAASLGAGSASAETVYDHFYSGVFTDGTGTTSGPFSTTVRRPAFDNTTDTLLVLDQGGGGVLRRFDSAGTPAPFSGSGTDSLSVPNLGSAPDVAVDESDQASRGNIYIVGQGGSSVGQVYGFNPAGEPLNGFPIESLFAPGGIAVDPEGDIWVSLGNGMTEFNSDGTRTGHVLEPEGLPVGLGGRPCQADIDSEGEFYFVNGTNLGCTQIRTVSKVRPTGELRYYVNTVNSKDVTVDRSDDSVYVTTSSPARVTHYTAHGAELESFGAADAAHFSYLGLTNPEGAAVKSANGDVWVTNMRNFSGTRRVEKFERSAPITVPTVDTQPATVIDTAAIKLRGVVNGDGVDTTECHFEWGTTRGLGESAPCMVGGVDTDVFPGGSGDNSVSVDLTGLVRGQPYYFRLSAENANGRPNRGGILVGYPQEPPSADAFVTAVNTDAARLSASIDPGGGEASYRFEWGTEGGVYEHVLPSPDGSLATPTDPEVVGRRIEGLTPGATYHYRVAVENQAGEFVGQDQSFTTYASPPGFEDTCDNALVRQQTGAALLRDCRAYELVSASYAGGYDVESNLVPGQTPFAGFPRARDRALYGVHEGGVPGPWNPTNRGVDPYLAVRGENGWRTEYAGLPAAFEGAAGLFSSPLAEADPYLGKLAFGGEGICDPCFADGSSNVPLRMPDGGLIKGMAGSLDPSADPAGKVARRFSADGSHFLFGSTAQFETDANFNGTDATIYLRDLAADTTEVVSKLPSGETIQNGDGVAALDISADGSRVVVGRLVSTDTAGNDYYRLYMYVGPGVPTIDLTPGSSDGALYDGMTADGATVYFTTRDTLATAADQDTDTSADIYRADVSGSSAELTRVSALSGAGGGGIGDTDVCDPVGTSQNERWNTVDATVDCSAAAIAGGGGVAAESGDLYFLSPEALDDGEPGAEPIVDAPNLYLARPGEAPHFVTTLESDRDLEAEPPMRHTESGSFGSFTNATGVALAPDGDVYVFDIGDSPRQIERYTAGGTLESVISGGLEQGTNLRADIPSQIATDPITGDLYVPIASNSGLNQNRRYSDTGVFLNNLSSQFSSSAVAVNPVDHNVYLGTDYPQVPAIVVRTPTNGLATEFEAGPYARGIAIDSRGRMYVATTTRTDLFSVTGKFIRTVATGPTRGVAVDPENDHVFVSQENRVLHFTSTGSFAGPVDIGSVATARGLVVGPNHRLYLVEGGLNGKVRWFDASPAPNLRTDNPAVLHAVNESGTRHTEDLQVTPDGQFAAFSSTLPLTGFGNRRRSEVYRYESGAGSLACASCAELTDAGPTTDTTLAHDGLNLTDDGSVFFTSSEPLVLRDSNNREDVYQWDPTGAELVSPGTSPYESRLLTASADGVDAFFFTRDTLVREDRNRSAVKLYDARVEGGFPFIPPPVPCKASDECHGPSSAAPAPLSIPTIRGTGGNESSAETPPHCARGKVRRGRRCVPRRCGKARVRRGKRCLPRKPHRGRRGGRKRRAR